MKVEIDLSEFDYERIKRLGKSGYLLSPSTEPVDVTAVVIQAGLRVMEREHCMWESSYGALEDEIAQELIHRAAQRAKLVNYLSRSVEFWNSLNGYAGVPVVYEAYSMAHRPGEPFSFRGRTAGPAVIVEGRGVVPLDNGMLIPVDCCKVMRGIGLAVPEMPVKVPASGMRCNRCGLPLVNDKTWCWDGINWHHDCPPVREVLAQIGEHSPRDGGKEG